MMYVLLLAVAIFVPMVLVQGIVLLASAGIFFVILGGLGIVTLGLWADYGPIVFIPYGVIVLGVLLWLAVRWFRRPHKPLAYGQIVAWSWGILIALCFMAPFIVYHGK